MIAEVDDADGTRWWFVHTAALIHSWTGLRPTDVFECGCSLLQKNNKKKRPVRSTATATTKRNMTEHPTIIINLHF
jgi:hypothetical protein